MRILLLTTLVPSGPPSGGTLATLDLSRRLEAYGEVERWAVWTFDPHAKENQSWHGVRPISLDALRRHGAMRALGRLIPLGVSRFHRADVARGLAAAGSFDLFFADHLGVWQYSRAVTAKRRVIYSHNVESEIYERAATLERSVIKRRLWRYEALAMRRYESRALREADAVVCPGTRDQSELRERYGVTAHAWYPPVGDVSCVARRQAGGNVIGSVGTMTWQANRWGMDWFVREVWPLVRERVPTATLLLAGRGSDRLPYAGVSGIQGLGVLSELTAFYDRLDVVVAPIVGGAGIKVKVMDAAARGLPVVTTPGGIEGFGAAFPSSIVVAAGATEFAMRVCEQLALRPHLPMMESVRWYQDLITAGSAAVDRAVRG